MATGRQSRGGVVVVKRRVEGVVVGSGAARRGGGGSVGASVVMCVRHVGSPRTATASRRRPRPRR